MRIQGFSIISGGKKLRGIIFNSNVKKPTKTVIISHGYASNMLITSPYAKTVQAEVSPVEKARI